MWIGRLSWFITSWSFWVFCLPLQPHSFSGKDSISKSPANGWSLKLYFLHPFPKLDPVLFPSFLIGSGVGLGRGEEVLSEPRTTFCLLSYNQMTWFSVPRNEIILPDSNLSWPCSKNTYLVMVHLLMPPKPVSPVELALPESIPNSSNKTFA